ncbi:GntR family transcriptional regulator [Jiangella endophytica]|uniref:GntR family transcriptional regulator n=1 Tax=Jiangella endophytica TaxID=1623398 RepID=UPI000E3484CA|nr:GntR family transcriptional regulator [Jiangella endophytica]
MEHRTMSEAAAAHIHEMIITGELEPGQPIRLIDLAQRLGTSPMPIREGLRKLESLGIVEIIAHRGAWVRELDLDDFRDTTATRLTLETIAVRQAAQRFDDVAAAASRTALDQLVAAVEAGDAVGARAAHTEFHFAIYGACGSRWLPRAIEPVWRNSERYRFGTHFTAEHLERTRREHERILQACIAHDEETAASAFTEHLTTAAERIESGMLARQGRRPSGASAP